MTRPRPRGRVAVSVVAGGRLTACPLSTPKWLRRCSAFHRERWSEDSRKLAWAEAHSGDGTISTDVMFEIFVEIGYRETRQTMVEARDQWPGGKEPRRRDHVGLSEDHGDAHRRTVDGHSERNQSASSHVGQRGAGQVRPTSFAGYVNGLAA
jgi:hypothetical protein